MIKNLFIGCLMVVVVSLLVGAAAFWYFFVQEKPQLNAVVDLPPMGVLDQPFELVVHATNPHTEAISFGSVDIETIFLDGFEVISVSPEGKDGTAIIGKGGTAFLEQKRWDFGHAVEPGGSFTVRFQLLPKKVGSHTGTLDVCNVFQNYTEHKIAIEIVAPAE